MHIGLIGGIGPAATVAYYRRLVDAARVRGAALELTIVHADTRKVMENVLSGRSAEQAQDFARLARRLAKSGADCVAITSLAGHFCFEEAATLSPLPMVSGIAPLQQYLVAQGIGCVGLLGTQLVMRTKLFRSLSPIRTVTLDDEIEDLGQTYQDMAMAGRCTMSQTTLFLEAGQRLVRDRGAEAVVLAGTDLNLAFDGQNPGYRVIDAMDVHVGVLADLAAGMAVLP